jgi:hypothetical protein
MRNRLTGILIDLSWFSTSIYAGTITVNSTSISNCNYGEATFSKGPAPRSTNPSRTRRVRDDAELHVVHDRFRNGLLGHGRPAGGGSVSRREDVPVPLASGLPGEN